MLGILLAAAASQLSAPVPTNFKDWVGPSDFPEYLLRSANDQVWKVDIRLVIDPDGKLRICSVEIGSGVRELDKWTCELIEKRAKFHPATWMDGSPVVGIYRTAFTWALYDQVFMPTDNNADLTISVAALPSGVKSPALVRVFFAVDVNGNISGCAAESWNGSTPTMNNPALVPIACEQLMQNYKPIPIKNASGKPIPSVQDALVQFSIAR